jgi:hypothetical protein
MDWNDLSSDRDQRRALVNSIINTRAAYNVGKFLSNCTTGSFSRRAQLNVVSYETLNFITIFHKPSLIRGTMTDILFV